MANNIYNFNNKDKTIAEQVSRLKSLYPNFNVTYSHLELKAIGEVQPTSRSDKYMVKIKYHLKELPEINVLTPSLSINFNGDKIPHVFSENRLCLYRPKYKEFTEKKYIADTIVPWTSLWLYYYEVWHITGMWHGGGEHPETK